MRKHNILSKIFVLLVLLYLYVPIIVLMVLSLNDPVIILCRLNLRQNGMRI